MLRIARDMHCALAGVGLEAYKSFEAAVALVRPAAANPQIRHES
jgi:hypothetical protein